MSMPGPFSNTHIVPHAYHPVCVIIVPKQAAFSLDCNRKSSLKSWSCWLALSSGNSLGSSHLLQSLLCPPYHGDHRHQPPPRKTLASFRAGQQGFFFFKCSLGKLAFPPNSACEFCFSPKTLELYVSAAPASCVKGAVGCVPPPG